MMTANLYRRVDGGRPSRLRVNMFAGAVVLAALLGAASSASAQESRAGVRAGGAAGGSLGVGVQTMLTGAGPFGAQLVYDAGMFHIEGIFGFASNGSTNLDLGGRFWYHIHAAQLADFSLGGGVGVVSVDPDGDVEGTTDVHINVGAQLRAFLVPNVALSVSAGLAIITGDADLVAVTGDLVGAAGVTYFF
jgi:hypothetical protein